MNIFKKENKKTFKRKIFEIISIVYIFTLLNIYNCYTIHIQKISHHRTSVVEMGIIESVGAGGESYAKILREAIVLGFLEKGHRIGVLQIPTPPSAVDVPVLDLTQLFLLRAPQPREGKLTPREIELRSQKDGFDVFLQGTLYSQRDPLSGAEDVVVSLTLSTKKGQVLQTVSFQEKKPGIAGMYSLGKSIAERISSLLPEGEVP